MPWAGLLVVGLVLLASPALAQGRPLPAPATGPHAVPVRLAYSRNQGAEVCPNKETLNQAVAEHVGHDLFTPDAPRIASVTIHREGGRFVASMEVLTAAGEQEWAHDPPLSRTDCRALVRAVGLSMAVTLDPATPLAPPRAEPAPAPTAPAPAPVVPQPPPARPALSKPEAAPLALAPVEVPKPGVFEGRAGFGRALLVGVTAGGLGTGIIFLAVAGSRGDEAQQLGGTLVQKTGSSACYASAPAVAGTCEQVVELRQQHDNFGRAAVGSFVAAGATAATASIWILRAPTAPSVQVTPSAPGSRAGLTVQGSW